MRSTRACLSAMWRSVAWSVPFASTAGGASAPEDAVAHRGRARILHRGQGRDRSRGAGSEAAGPGRGGRGAVGGGAVGAAERRSSSRTARGSTAPPNSALQLSSTERASIRYWSSISSTQPALIPNCSRYGESGAGASLASGFEWVGFASDFAIGASAFTEGRGGRITDSRTGGAYKSSARVAQFSTLGMPRFHWPRPPLPPTIVRCRSVRPSDMLSTPGILATSVPS